MITKYMCGTIKLCCRRYYRKGYNKSIIINNAKPLLCGLLTSEFLHFVMKKSKCGHIVMVKRGHHEGLSVIFRVKSVTFRQVNKYIP